MTDQLHRGADAPPVSLSMVFNLTRKKSLEQHEQIRTRTGLPLVAKAIGVVTLPNAALNNLAGVDVPGFELISAMRLPKGDEIVVGHEPLPESESEPPYAPSAASPVPAKDNQAAPAPVADDDAIKGYTFLDFECAFGGKYDLEKLKNVNYIRDERFQALVLSIAEGNGQPFSIVGPEAIATYCAGRDRSKTFIMIHNAPFDAFVLADRYGAHPGQIGDTLAMARAIYGPSADLGLGDLF
jgi:hypothetical protein